MKFVLNKKTEYYPIGETVQYNGVLYQVIDNVPVTLAGEIIGTCVVGEVIKPKTFNSADIMIVKN